MRLLAIDPFHGAAGDMICGALLSAGAGPEPVLRAMESVVHAPRIEQVTRCGIAAVKVHTQAGQAHRSLEEVVTIVRGADAPAEVITRAERIFSRIAAAEESVHGKMTHFHEVGADDAIADVIGSCMALHLLAADRVMVLPVATGKGTVRCCHGILPVPAPATAAILASGELLVYSGDADGEQLTPTGAAILSEIGDETGRDLPPGRIIKTGYGAGDREDPESPNVLRVIIMDCQGLSNDTVDILETNVDDVPGEVIGSVLSLVMEKGARDATAIPLLMKKGRPGYLVRIISPVTLSPRLSEILARELGTLGIRVTPAVHRFVAGRCIQDVEVSISGGTFLFPVKYGYIGGECYMVKPEFSVVEKFAREYDLPVRDLLSLVEKAGKRQAGADKGI
ncbi:MAG: nickel pincer cofactor biosynthesis protein LarC [Methanospirillum sp.]|nr:nickel pincer cofactor biosynthesis protein LarC [Methanospirillum sp.]